MKRLISCLLPILLIFSFACAEPEQEYKYISLGDSGFPIADLLHLIGCDYVFYNGSDGLGEPVLEESAVECLQIFQDESGLEPTGVFDAETIILATAIADADPNDLVWIPMHGGQKYHRKEDCSNMIEPRQMPKACAAHFGFSPCGKCARKDR